MTRKDATSPNPHRPRHPENDALASHVGRSRLESPVHPVVEVVDGGETVDDVRRRLGITLTPEGD